jgi:hypothetical protein
LGGSLPDHVQHIQRTLAMAAKFYILAMVERGNFVAITERNLVKTEVHRHLGKHNFFGISRFSSTIHIRNI